MRYGQTSGGASARVHYCCFPASRLDERTAPAFRAVRHSSPMLNAEIGLIHATCKVDVKSRTLHLTHSSGKLLPTHSDVHRHGRNTFKRLKVGTVRPKAGTIFHVSVCLKTDIQLRPPRSIFEDRILSHIRIEIGNRAGISERHNEPGSIYCLVTGEIMRFKIKFLTLVLACE